MPTKAKKLAVAKRTSKSVKANTVKPSKKAAISKPDKKNRFTLSKASKKNKLQTKMAMTTFKKSTSASAKNSGKKNNKSLTQKTNVLMKKSNKNTAQKKTLTKSITPFKKAVPKKLLVSKKVVSKKLPVKKTKTLVPLTTVKPAGTIKSKQYAEKKAKPIQRVAMTGTAMDHMGIAPYKEKPHEAYMSEMQREHFRKILNNWRQQLLEEMDRTMHHLQDEAANFPDPNDRATQEEEFSLELRARDRERKLIKKIEEALQRIEENEYGYCESCGVEIGIRRLEARPTATLCIDCKTLDEIREKQLGG